MISHIMDEDEPVALQVFDVNNDYMETCDTEVNDVIPRLQKLTIDDNELLYFASGLCMDTDSSSTKQFESASIAYSNEDVSPMLVGNIASEIRIIEDSKMAVDSNISPSETEKTLLDFSMNTEVVIQSQNGFQKAFEGREILMHPIDANEEQLMDKAKDIGAENVCDMDPLNYSLKRSLDHNNETKCISKNKTLHQSYIHFPKKKRYIDNKILAIEGTKVAFSKKSPSETGEILHDFSMNIQDDIQSQNVIRNASDSGEYRMHPIDANEEQLVGIAIGTVEKVVYDEEPLDFSCTKPDLDYNNEVESSRVVSENKTEHQSYIPEKNCPDPDTGQAIVHSNVILPDSPGRNDEENALDLSIDTATSTTSDDSSKLSYSADASSDDQSSTSGVLVDSPPSDSSNVGKNANSVRKKRSRNIRDFVPPDMDASGLAQRHFGIFQPPSSITDASKTNYSDKDSSQTKVNDISEVNANSVEKKRSRKVRVFVSPVAGMNKVRQRRFSTFQPPSSIIDASKTTSSDEDSSQTTRVNDITAVDANSVEKKRSRKVRVFASPVAGMSKVRQRRFSIFQSPSSNIDSSKTGVKEEDTPKKSRRKGKKIVKISPKLTTMCNSNVKDEEKRPSPCKRKTTTPENLTETNGKIRKRTITLHNLETSENTRSLIRPRSLSCGLKITFDTSVTDQPAENSVSKSARKRTNSGNHNANRVKSHKSSTSSDEA